MKKIKTAMEYQKEQLIKKGKLEGKLEGLFESAIRIKDTLGIEKALELSDFSREELLTGKMNPKF